MFIVAGVGRRRRAMYELVAFARLECLQIDESIVLEKLVGQALVLFLHDRLKL